jgi:hypothetical protein
VVGRRQQNDSRTSARAGSGGSDFARRGKYTSQTDEGKASAGDILSKKALAPRPGSTGVADLTQGQIDKCLNDHQDFYNALCEFMVYTALPQCGDQACVAQLQMYWCDNMTAFDKALCDCLNPPGAQRDSCFDFATEFNNTCNDDWNFADVAAWGCVFLPPAPAANSAP